MRIKRIIDKISSPRAIFLAGVMVVIVACFVAYIPAIKGGFIWDDDRYVTDNPLLTAPHGLYYIWFSTNSPSQYFPLTYTSFWVEKRLWNLNPAGFHSVNVTIHCLNALLLWLILSRLSIPWAWLASAIFALHPVQVESVAWITERKNILMLFFSLLSVLCWVEFVFGGKSRNKAIWLYALALLFCALALFSKATACTLPVALVLILWLKHSSVTAKRWLQIAPFIVLGIGIGLLVMWWERHHQGTSFVNFGFSPAGKILIAGRALWFYLWKLIWPVNLTFSYPRWNIDATDGIAYIWPVSFIAMATAAWLLRKRIGIGISTALVFFCAMLFPMLGFSPLYTFVYTFVADHYQYAASIGPIAVLAAGGGYLFSRLSFNGKAILLLVAGTLLVILGTLTWRQCGAYKNPDTLWADTLKKNPDSWLAHACIGESLSKQGRYVEALPHFKQVIKIAPYMKTVLPYRYAVYLDDCGIALTNMGRLDEAIVYYQHSLDVWEHFVVTHFNLGLILAQKGNVERARQHFLRALEIIQDKKDVQLNQILCPQCNLNQLNEEIHRQLNLLGEKNIPIIREDFIDSL